MIRARRAATAMCCLGFLCMVATAAQRGADITPLRHAHAHNDYAHARPLHDALDQGFCSVEADVFLTETGDLLVGHTRWELRTERTLEKLYLAPLQECITRNRGRVYPGGPAFQLLIDIKSSGPATYAALHRLFARYAAILSEVKGGQITERAVNVVISGNCPRDDITRQELRYAAIDGRQPDLTGAAPTHLVPLVSLPWRSHFTWNGVGAFSDLERGKLSKMVKQAHERGRRLRFWGCPDSETCWRIQRDIGVDWLNTDKLKEMRAFSTSNHASPQE